MDEKHADIFQDTEGLGFWLLKLNIGTSLVVQWIRILLANARDAGLIPGQETTIPHVVEQLSPHAGTTEPAHQPLETPVLQRNVPPDAAKIARATTKDPVQPNE